MAEARVAAAPGLFVLAGGGHAERLANSIEAAIAAGGTSIVSFGIAGGLSPDLKPGNWCVAKTVISDSGRYRADPVWADRLLELIDGAELCDMIGSDRPIANTTEKRALHEATGAATVDMESHIAARVAADYKLPFAAARVVADPVGRSLPPAALVGMHADGSVNVPAVFNSILRRPHQLPALMRIAQDTRTAFQSLFSGRQMLGPRFGFDDFGELLLNVA